MNNKLIDSPFIVYRATNNMGSDLFLTNLEKYYLIYSLLSSTSARNAFKKITFISINLVIFYVVISYTLSTSKDMEKITVGGFVDEVFAQDTTALNGSGSNAGSISTNPNLQALNKTIPVLSRISHNGSYEVQLLWSVPQSLQSPNILPEDGFDMQIQFLDANAPDPANRTITAHNMISDGLQPIPIIEPLLPVSNYDLTIFSEEGDIIWQQNDRAPTGGRGFERVILDDPYEGGITISITDIRSPQNNSIDSVQFPARLG